MATICLDQALIALHAHSRMAIGWLVAFGVFVGVTALGDDLFLRVELGLLASSLWAFVWMSVCLWRAPAPPADGSTRSTCRRAWPSCRSTPDRGRRERAARPGVPRSGEGAVATVVASMRTHDQTPCHLAPREAQASNRDLLVVIGLLAASPVGLSSPVAGAAARPARRRRDAGAPDLVVGNSDAPGAISSLRRPRPARATGAAAAAADPVYTFGREPLDDVNLLGRPRRRPAG